ncbi:hypothetical protein TNCV_1223311 [Trichonephila clavipes]|nr:hypothetical protein TNCV_1223311 [Trichonephila clavipes]
MFQGHISYYHLYICHFLNKACIPILRNNDSRPRQKKIHPYALLHKRESGKSEREKGGKEKQFKNKSKLLFTQAGGNVPLEWDILVTGLDYGLRKTLCNISAYGRQISVPRTRIKDPKGGSE